MSKRVLLADDHPIFRAGLRQILEGQSIFDIVAEAGNGDSCIDRAKILSPDIIVTDLSMPGKSGFEIASWARQDLPNTRIVVLSMYSQRGFVEKARKCGAHGFVAKEDAETDLIEALQSDMAVFYRSSSLDRNNAGDSSGEFFDDFAAMLDVLTGAEATVLQQIAPSRTSPQIADDLDISVRTVQTHRQNISSKLNLHGANSLLNFAVKHEDIILANSS